MEPNRIYKKLDELHSNPKSKNFLNHLIRAYLPSINVTEVFEKPSTKFRCVLTNAPLVTIPEAIETINSEKFKKTFSDHLKTWVHDSPATDRPIEKILVKKAVGFTGEDTSTFMSQEAFLSFYDWAVDKVLHGDKRISWLLDSTSDEFINRAERLAKDEESKKALDLIKTRVNESKKAMTTFGDLDALKQLKAKFESQ